MSWYKRAILDQPYGGFPSGGGFGCNMEYEIGAQRIAEAAHCIIGSCARIDWNSIEPSGDISHMEEEIGIIQNVIDEYSRDVYLEQFKRESKSEWTVKCIDSIRKTVPKLREMVRQKTQEFKHDDPMIFNIVSSSMKVMDILSQAILESIKDYPNMTNAFRTPQLKQEANNLERYIKDIREADEASNELV